MKIIGHRGAPRHFLENTLNSLSYANEFADGLEFDIQQLKTGEWVVFHDDTITERLVDKTTISSVQDIKLIDLTYSQINLLRLINGDKILLVEEMINKLEKNKQIFIEIKGNYTDLGLDNLISINEKYKYIDYNISYISFDVSILKYLFDNTIENNLFFIVDDVHKIEEFTSMYNSLNIPITGIMYPSNPYMITKELVDIVHEHNLLFSVWVKSNIVDGDTMTIREYMKSIGVDHMTSNVI